MLLINFRLRLTFRPGPAVVLCTGPRCAGGARRGEGDQRHRPCPCPARPERDHRGGGAGVRPLLAVVPEAARARPLRMHVSVVHPQHTLLQRARAVPVQDLRSLVRASQPRERVLGGVQLGQVRGEAIMEAEPFHLAHLPSCARA
jgi:hypothetical protein